MTITVPYPPTVNHYWRPSEERGRLKLTERGKRFRADVKLAVIAERQTQPLRERLSVSIALYPPDKRKRDIDNIAKAVLDALKHAGVFEDDEQVDLLTINRSGVDPPGRAVVTITEAT